MARKKATTTPTAPEQPPEAVQGPFDPVKANNANLTELKLALDDSVRRYFSRPDQFRTKHTHSDTRIGLGVASVIVGIATGLYGWKTEFEASKTFVAIGVFLYFFLTALQTAYTYFVEGKTIFVGKRKTLVNRIETETITLSSETKPAPTPTSSPSYSLSLSYLRSSHGGKTLIKRNNLSQAKDYVLFFDSEGNLDQVAFVAWLRELSTSLIDGASSPMKTLDSVPR